MIKIMDENLDRYRASLKGIETLSVAEERLLARKFREGDQAAGARLVTSSLPFVITIALEYRRWGAPLEDLVQQGNLGLLKAAHKFDPARDCRLVTYAVYWIRAEIRDYVVRAYRTVRIGTTKGERKALRLYRKTKEDDAVALAAASGLPLDQVERLLPVLRARDTSLDATFDGEAAKVDSLAAVAPSPEEQVGQQEFEHDAQRRVRAALATLPEREAMIVRERLLADEPVTLEALGQRLGISKERVRQLEDRARARLRAQLSEAAMHAAA